MKCVCWDIASIDFEYRYEFTKKPLGECSSYFDKNTIYKDLVKVAKKYNITVNEIFQHRENLIKYATDEIQETFENTNLSIWAQAAFFEFKEILKLIKKNHVAGEGDILADTTLKSWYTDHLYRHRNRVAHNTSSYQQNLPTLKTLIGENYKYENYFLFFFILILIDKIFIDFHKKLLQADNEKAD